MTVAYDVDHGGADELVAPTFMPRRSWLIEFLTTPFKDVDSRAEWKRQSKAASRRDEQRAS